jgi:photosystem II stability/assembly factor-like uncharacterized protein
MTDTLYLATNTGLVICQRDNDTWRTIHHTLKNQYVTCLIAREGVILAGTMAGIHRSDDEGQTWSAVNAGLTHHHIRWLAYHPEISDLEFAGTEPAGIFVSRDGAKHWQTRPEVATLRDEHEWMLPYSPQAGCVRGFTFHGQRLYAAVEVGGVLRSDDGGESWNLAEGSDGNPDLAGPPEPYVYPDIHDLVVHPSDPDLVWAATGGGLYRTGDGGATWELVYDCYCRGLWLDPDNANHILFGPAKYVGRVATIQESRDGGRSWHSASDGVDVPFPNTLPERISRSDNELFIVLDDGRLLTSSLEKLHWKYILGDVPGINAFTSMQE